MNIHWGPKNTLDTVISVHLYDKPMIMTLLLVIWQQLILLSPDYVPRTVLCVLFVITHLSNNMLISKRGNWNSWEVTCSGPKVVWVMELQLPPEHCSPHSLLFSVRKLGAHLVSIVYKNGRLKSRLTLPCSVLILSRWGRRSGFKPCHHLFFISPFSLGSE